MTADSSFRQALSQLEEIWKRGDIEGLHAILAPDARMLPHMRSSLDDLESIESWVREAFAAYDTSAYVVRYDVVDEHGDSGYAVAEFDEMLRSRDGGPDLEIKGRIVIFWRRDHEGRWRLSRLLTGRSAPDVHHGRSPDRSPRHGALGGQL